jgi:hypothetical protein
MDKLIPGLDYDTQWFGAAFSGIDMGGLEKILAHTTEGRTWPGYSMGASAPNATFHPLEMKWRGHFADTQSARALKDPDSTVVRENRDKVWQFEIVAYSDQAKAKEVGGLWVGDLTDEHLTEIARVWVNLHKRHSVPLTLASVWIMDSSAYGAAAPQRMTGPAYDAFKGFLGHQHAPGDLNSPVLGNVHWDPAGLVVTRLRDIAVNLATPTPAPDPDPTQTILVSVNEAPSNLGYAQVLKQWVNKDRSLWLQVENVPVPEPEPVPVPEPTPIPVPIPVPVPVPAPGFDINLAGDVWIGLLKYGTDDSDSVRRMQKVLNGIPLPPPGNVTIDLTSGRYGPQTDTVVRTWQDIKTDDMPDPVGQSSVGPKQAALLFAGTPCILKTGVPGLPTPVPTPTPPPSSDIVTPIVGSSISTPFGKKGTLWAAGYHTGDDWIAGVGTAVRTTWTGKIVGVYHSGGWGSAYGTHVIQEFKDYQGRIRRQAFCHLSVAQVSVGQILKPGNRIGLSGATGHVTGPHLHLEQRFSPYLYNNVAVKPVY